MYFVVSEYRGDVEVLYTGTSSLPFPEGRYLSSLKLVRFINRSLFNSNLTAAPHHCLFYTNYNLII